MDRIELTILVNKVNTGKVREVATAHGGSLQDRTTAHALAETEEPAVPLAEKVIDHDILDFAFNTAKEATDFVDAASAAIGVAPGIFKGTLTARQGGKKIDLPLQDKNQAAIKQG